MSETQEQYETTNDRLTAEILQALAAPFPAAAHEIKRMGGADITFVGWHHYVTRLNDVAPEWSMGDPIIHTIGDKLLMGLPLTILGVTRINFGDEDSDKDSYGTAGTNAYAQAFKRSCAMFGLGLYLYDGGGIPQPTKSQQRRQTAQQRPQPSGPMVTMSAPEPDEPIFPDDNDDALDAAMSVAQNDARLVVMPFGKCKGMTMSEIAANDAGYLKWLASDAFKPEQEVAETVQRAARAVYAHIKSKEA